MKQDEMVMLKNKEGLEVENLTKMFLKRLGLILFLVNGSASGLCYPFSFSAFIAALYIDKDLEYVHTFMNVCFFPRLKVSSYKI